LGKCVDWIWKWGGISVVGYCDFGYVWIGYGCGIGEVVYWCILCYVGWICGICVVGNGVLCFCWCGSWNDRVWFG